MVEEKEKVRTRGESRKPNDLPHRPSIVLIWPNAHVPFDEGYFEFKAKF